MNPEISKTARDLLAKQPAAELHPSPDLLNGYVEQSLSPAENTQVLTHLSSCADCREVVFLASGAEEEVVLPLVAAAAKPVEARPLAAAMPVSDELRGCAVLEPGPKRKNVWWKWAAPLAALVIVGSTALLERDRIVKLLSPPPTETANIGGKSTAAPATPATEARSPQALILPPKQPSKAAADRAASEERPQAHAYDSRMDKPVAGAQAGAKEDALRRRMLEAQLASNLENRGANAIAIPQSKPTLPPPSASTEVEVTAAAPLVQADNADLAATADSLKAESLAKSSLVANNQAVTGTAAAVSMSRHQAASSHWRIGKAGQLERSTGAGTWTQKLASEEVTFRAVATVGSDVWAGGNGGALFHSSDAGEHFNKVVLSVNGRNENGAIVSIHFDTAQEGSVTSDSGSTWTTTDGGQSWSRQ